MDLEVVTVGTELLLGFTLDGNTAAIGRLLSHIGCNVVRSTSVPDNVPAIQDAVSSGLSRTGVVVVTGGLGPTRDDVTKKAVADLFNVPLDVDGAYLELLRHRWARLGAGPMPQANLSQAEVPRGAITLTNARGTAPGLWLEGVPGTVIMLPGVPLEMRALMELEVVPRLRCMMVSAGENDAVTRSRTLRTTGISESRLGDELGEAESLLGDAVLSYLPDLDGVDLRLTVRCASDADAERTLDRAEQVLRPRLGGGYYGSDSTTLAAVVIETLRGKGMRLAVAESCTGGLVGARLTAEPGASDVFAGGIICYANESKVRDLRVSPDEIAAWGAVSEPVAKAMATGVRERFEADVGVAVTGIAGPGGGTDEKPVGTVWLAAALGPVVLAVERWFPGGRNAVRQRSSQAALDLVRRALDTA